MATLASNNLSMIPVAIFDFTAVCSMATSVLMHTFWSKSEKDCSYWLYLDFLGILTLVCGSTTTAVHVIYSCSGYYSLLFNSFLLIFTGITIFMINTKIFWENQVFKVTTFVLQTSSVIVPIFYWYYLE